MPLYQSLPVDTLVEQLRQYGAPAPQREYRFAPLDAAGKHVRQWRADLAWPALQLAVEIDGGMYTGGRHGGSPSVERDLEKRAAYAILGWRVLHVTPTQVKRGIAFAWTLQALEIEPFSF